MRYLVAKDKWLRNQFLKEEARYLVLKSLSENMYLGTEVREKLQLKLSKIGGKKIRIKNRCVLTGRKGGVLRDFWVSRIAFKELAKQGMLLGVKKASW